MKTVFAEFDRAFSIEFEAETLQDAAMLVRLALNKTQEICTSSYAYEDGQFSGHIRIKKRTSCTSKIPEKGRGR